MYTTNPEYWWEQAQICHEVATLLAHHVDESMSFRKELFNQCHASLERQLKAILAQEHQLSDSCAQTHSLNRLIHVADLNASLTPLQKDFLSVFSGMHGKSTYPEEETILHTWNSDTQMTIMIKRYKELRDLFAHAYEAGREAGEQDGRD